MKNLTVPIGFHILSKVNGITTVAFYVHNKVTHIIAGDSDVIAGKIEGFFK